MNHFFFLSFTETEDEDLWKLFGDCGDIESVRIVRDSKTGISKGIGYVNFRSKDGVELALKMDGADLKGRPVRIKRISNNVKRQKEKEERIKKEQISNSEAYQLRREKKDKKFQGVKLAPKTVSISITFGFFRTFWNFEN